MTRKPNNLQTVMVTGGSGYLGSALVEMLLGRGYRVLVLDRFFFGSTLRHLEAADSLRLIKDDIRWFESELLVGVDAVLDLAALSNDPAGELEPEKTMEINYRGRVRVATFANNMGVKRYILASSCSVYGFQDGILDETSTVNPLTTYAEANYLAEQNVIPMADEDFIVTALRPATMYGPSQRMRFDLVLNGMILSLFNSGKITVGRDGKQWRPIVHIQDVCQAFLRVLEADPDQVNGEVFNVGSDDQNFRILPLAELCSKAVGIPFEVEWYGEVDHRSYRTSAQKIQARLGYVTKHTPEETAREIYTALGQRKLVDTPNSWTADWYKQLMNWHTTLSEIVLNDVVL